MWPSVDNDGSEASLEPITQTNISAEQFRAELDRNFRLPLIAFFLKRTSNRSEAEDLTQEVLLCMLRQSETIKVQTAKSYVFTAAANLLRDRARQAAIRKTETSGTLDDPTGTSRYLIEEISPERVLVGRQTLKDVLAALDHMNERTRDIFVLHRIERLKQHEIAALLGISQSSVEKHLVKAMTYLTRRFDRP